MSLALPAGSRARPGFAAEERHQYPNLALLLIDLVDLAAEIGERTVDDANGVAKLKGILTFGASAVMPFMIA